MLALLLEIIPDYLSQNGHKTKLTDPDMDKRTLSRMDAAPERTGMYSQRVRVPYPDREIRTSH